MATKSWKERNEDRATAKAIADLVTVDNETDQFCCRVCQRLYKTKGFVIRHIEKEHPDAVNHIAEEILAESKHSAVCLGIEWIERTLRNVLKNYEDALEDYADYVKEVGPSTAATYKLASVTKAEVRAKEATRISNIWRLCKERGDYYGFYSYISDQEKKTIEKILRCGSQSTNPISNAVGIAKTEAQKELVREFGLFRDIFKLADELTDNLEELEALNE